MFLRITFGQSGFSLIELLLALVITAILMSLAIPSYESLMRRSRLAEGRAHLLQLQADMERFLLSQGYYPESLNELRKYDAATIESKNQYFELFIDNGLMECALGPCYALVARPLLQQRASEKMTLYSDGRQLGAW